MAQMLSLFSNVEQSRFQAYKRSTFNATAIENYVSSCLIHKYHKATTIVNSLLIPSITNSNDDKNRNLYYQNVIWNTASVSSTTNPSRGRQQQQQQSTGANDHNGQRRFNSIHRPLSDLVAPGQHEDIGLIVTIIAKIYAQRLVKAAIAYQKEQQQQEKEEHRQQLLLRQNEQQLDGSNTSSTNGVDNATNVPMSASHHNQQQPLRPLSLWKVILERQRRGIDPGFFLQSNQESTGNVNLSSSYSEQRSYHNTKRLAALHAQDEYQQLLDKVLEEEKKEMIEEMNNNQKKVDTDDRGSDDEDPMEVETAVVSDDLKNKDKASDDLKDNKEKTNDTTTTNEKLNEEGMTDTNVPTTSVTSATSTVTSDELILLHDVDENDLMDDFFDKDNEINFDEDDGFKL